MHIVRIAHGIGASVICAVVFYIGGIAFCRDRTAAHSGHCTRIDWCSAVCGHVLVRRDRGILGLAGCADLRRCRAAARSSGASQDRQPDLADPAFRKEVRQSFTVFALLYVLAYLFTLPPATADQLPVAWTGNLDLMTYARYTRYFLRARAVESRRVFVPQLRLPADARPVLPLRRRFRSCSTRIRLSADDAHPVRVHRR